MFYRPKCWEGIPTFFFNMTFLPFAIRKRKKGTSLKWKDISWGKQTEIMPLFLKKMPHFFSKTYFKKINFTNSWSCIATVSEEELKICKYKRKCPGQRILSTDFHTSRMPPVHGACYQRALHCFSFITGLDLHGYCVAITLCNALQIQEAFFLIYF